MTSSLRAAPLFAPADRPGLLEKAARGADAVIADLEDGVAPGAKAAARERVRAWLEAPAETTRLVRVNGLLTPAGLEDLAELPLTRCDAVVVSKADVRSLRGWPFETPVIALVETARGVRELDQIASFSWVERLQLGHLDLAAELGVAPDSPLMEHVRTDLVLASAAARLPAPWDGVHADLADEDGLAASARAARALGFGGKACIHPRQVAVVRDAFAPTEQELAWARNVLDAVELTGDVVAGAIAVDGQMVDLPVITRARSILESTA